MKLKKYLAVVILSVAGLTGCISTGQVNNQAANSYMQVVSKVRAKGLVDTRSATSRRIHTIFKQMVPYANQENKTGVPFNWEVTVAKSKELNAWAMPGGKMMFYTGLVDKLNLSDNEIATVMGHEMAHALKEHSKSAQNMGMITGLAVQLGKVALQTQGISTNVGGIDMVDLTKDLALDKPFSRHHESEADEVGLLLMAQAGYNPSAAPGLWVKMSKASGSGGISLFSTHPSNAERQENLQRLLPKAMEIYKRSQR